MKNNLIGFTLACVFLVAGARAQNDSVFYHDHSFESQYGASGAFPSTDYLQCLARFTPAFYPAKITGIRAYFRNPANPAHFRFIIYEDSTGAAAGPAGLPVYAGAITSNPESGGIMDTVYSSFVDLSSDNLILTAGDFYCGVTQHVHMNGFAGAALDAVPQNNAVADRQWISTSQGSASNWFQMLQWAGGGQWGFTAFFDYMTGISQNFSDSEFIRYSAMERRLYSTLSCELAVCDRAGVVVGRMRVDLNHSCLDLGSLKPGLYVAYNG